MSVAQYQRIVNSLDKDIADLEKKKAVAEKKAADEVIKATTFNIPTNGDPELILKRVFREIDIHIGNANKARSESASITKKIADKRKKRNDAYTHLQKEQQAELKKQDKG